MSLSIATAPTAAPSSDGPAGIASATSKGTENSVPFDAFLDEQNSADEGALQQIGDPANSIGDGPAESVQSAPESFPVESLPFPFGPFVHGARGRLIFGADIVHGADAASKDEKDLAASAALLLMTPFEIPQPPVLPDKATATATQHPASSTAHPPSSAEVERQLLQALAETAVPDTPAAKEQADSRLAKITDAWTKAAADNVQTETIPPDLARPAPGPPATVAAFADAIRLAANAGASGDRDPGSNQPSMTMGFDRSNGKAASAIHLVQPMTTFETTLGSAQAAPGTSVALPNETNVASSIVQAMRLQMRDGVGTAVVHLEPDYLGAVSIALRVEGGVVTATLHAENPQVRTWMAANEPLLRQGLSDQGLSLDRLLVSDARVSEDPSGRRRQDEQEPQARPKPRRAESGIFEVVV